MIKNLRKAFTIIELVIVIAVIAVLAAVLIPTFSSLVDKANNNIDTQLIRNLNVALRADVTNEEKHKTMHSALLCAKDAGYDIQKINAQGADNEILWDSVNDVFCYYDSKDGKVKYVPESNIEEDSVKKVDYFKIYEEMPDISDQTYSIYLNNNSTSEDITVNVGFDAGYNENIRKVSYEGDKEVVIRTTSEACGFVMSSGTVNHYGIAATATVNGGIYNCFAELVDKELYGGENQPTTLFAGGKGTEESPYLISDSDQFSNINNINGKTYIKLVSDVELPNATNQYGGVINDFSGVFDGNGKSIITNGSGYIFGSITEVSTIKNVNVINAGGTLNQASMLVWKGNAPLTFENVNIYGNSDIQYNFMSYRVGSYIYIPFDDCNFINCANYMNIKDKNSTGLFVSNYPDPSNRNIKLVFKNCYNYGTVSAPSIGFFIGNSNSKDYTIIDNENYQKPVGTGQVFIYIENCVNKGTIIGTTYVGPMNLEPANNINDKDYEDINNNILTKGSFIKGNMFVSTIDVSLNKTEDNYVQVVCHDENVTKYQISYSVGTNFSDGSGYFRVIIDYSADEINNCKIKYISKIMTDKQYQESTKLSYDSITDDEKEDASGHKYKIAQIGQEFVAVVTESSLVSRRTSGAYLTGISSSPSYLITCLGNEDALLGSKIYNPGELEK